MVKRDFIAGILLIVTVILVFVGLQSFVFGTYTIQERDSNSFLNTGDQVLFSRRETPDYGNLVIYEVDNETHIGRVIGQAGDQLMSVEDILYRNQEVVEQPYIEEMKRAYLSKTGHEMPFTPDFSLAILLDDPDATVPKGQYFVLNDNRQEMTDSREFGPIARQDIKGVLIFRLKPFESFGFLRTE
ncbi:MULTISPECIES: signal peptidase I [unclassified Streptococcus]|uniref:signal peptidase I n=1 Tax=unclassified Streptococcus TaxID=2608887 RepID=UPI00359D2460